MIKFETIYEGTTFLGAEIAFLEDEITPIIVEGKDVQMHIKRKGDPEIVLSYTTANGKLDTQENKIIIPEHIPALEFGKYEFDFNIKFSDTTIETGVARGEWEILNPITAWGLWEGVEENLVF